VFDLQNKESDAFNLSLRNVAEYIARSIPNGGEFMQALNPDDLGFNALTPPADPPEKATAVQMETWKMTARQLLYLAKRTRPDILPTVSFLCTRVQQPDVDDWKKLGRCLRFIRGTKDDPLTLEAKSMTSLYWWVDASFAVHPNMRSHTGANRSEKDVRFPYPRSRRSTHGVLPRPRSWG